MPLLTYHSWCITVDLQLLAQHSDLLLLEYPSWLATFDRFLLTCWSWLVTFDLSLLTCNSWNVTLDLELLTCHSLFLTTCHIWLVTLYIQGVPQYCIHFWFWISRLPWGLEIPSWTFFNSPFRVDFKNIQFFIIRWNMDRDICKILHGGDFKS